MDNSVDQDENNIMEDCLNKYFLPILTGVSASDYYTSGTISGDTDDSKLMYVFAGLYNSTTNQPIYTPGINTTLLDIDKVFDGIISNQSNIIKYVIGAKPNNIPNTGIHYTTFADLIVYDKDSNGAPISYRKTIFESGNAGRNQYNTSLSPLIKDEEYLGVVFKPEVESDVFIDRGIADIFERHAILSEIKTTNDIDTNRGGIIRA